MSVVCVLSVIWPSTARAGTLGHTAGSALRHHHCGSTQTHARMNTRFSPTSQSAFNLRTWVELQRQAGSQNPKTCPHTQPHRTPQTCCSPSSLSYPVSFSSSAGATQCSETVQMNTLLYLYLSKNSDLWSCRSLHKYWRNWYKKKKAATPDIVHWPNQPLLWFPHPAPVCSWPWRARRCPGPDHWHNWGDGH